MDRRRAASLIGCAALWPQGIVRAQEAGSPWLPERLERLREQIQAHPYLRALIVERGGVTGFEHFRADTQAATKLNVASVTKSVVSLLVGIAIDRGHIAGVEEPLAAFFPEFAQGPHAETLARVKLKHLLTLSPGFDRRALGVNTDYSDFAQRLFSPGLLPFAMSRRLVDEPGKSFYYSNLDSHLAAVALSRRIKGPMQAFAKDELFTPLGIESVEWAAGQDGVPDGAAGLRVSPGDMQRIGRMLVQGGRWRDRQVVSRRYVEEATARHVDTGLPARGPRELWGYGYLFWTSSTPADNLPSFSAAGYGGQFIHCVPALDLVVVAVTQQVSRDVAARTSALIRDYVVAAARRQGQ